MDSLLHTINYYKPIVFWILVINAISLIIPFVLCFYIYFTGAFVYVAFLYIYYSLIKFSLRILFLWVPMWILMLLVMKITTEIETCSVRCSCVVAEFWLIGHEINVENGFDTDNPTSLVNIRTHVVYIYSSSTLLARRMI